ncbi:MAG: SRPBCC domain-containing protein [Bacteroidota bacterium]|nr:SRPBCC domain-containing protein [Bacteroidota bacterium]
MKTSLLFEFTADKVNNKILIKREFNANQNMVWDAFTKPEILDQWWAPKPFISKTKSMDFKVGGRRLYTMCGPNGEEYWDLADYVSISPKTNFQYVDGFCDSEGNINTEIPQSKWNVDFVNQGNTTLVDITITYETLADLEKIIELGFKEGFTLALNNLDGIFKK